MFILCHDCAFHITREELIECIHPDEYDVNCAVVTFCSSFQPMQEVDSPCVSFDNEITAPCLPKVYTEVVE
jgi:putative hydrolases of HD superfamily